MKKILIYGGMVLLLGGSLIVAPQQASAQTPTELNGTPGGEIGGDGNGISGDGPVVPLDGGLSCILLASAIGYGMKQTKTTVQEEN